MQRHESEVQRYQDAWTSALEKVAEDMAKPPSRFERFLCWLLRL